MTVLGTQTPTSTSSHDRGPSTKTPVQVSDVPTLPWTETGPRVEDRTRSPLGPCVLEPGVETETSITLR